jgi:hypothetical protein
MGLLIRSLNLYKKFCEELPTFLSYYMDRIENDASNNSSLQRGRLYRALPSIEMEIQRKTHTHTRPTINLIVWWSTLLCVKNAPDGEYQRGKSVTPSDCVTHFTLPTMFREAMSVVQNGHVWTFQAEWVAGDPYCHPFIAPAWRWK